MKRWAALSVLTVFLTAVGTVLGQSVSWTQYLFVARNVFPQADEICVLLPQDKVDGQKEALSRAASHFRFKVKLYLFSDALDIGRNLKMIPEKSVLIVSNSPLTEEKSTMLYILSQAKEKEISIISASQNYVDSGALIGLVKENGRLRVVVNLKFSQQMAGIFTPEFNRKIGIIKVIQ